MAEFANIAEGGEAEFIRSKESKPGHPVNPLDNLSQASLIASIEILMRNGFKLSDAFMYVADRCWLNETQLLQLRKDYGRGKKWQVAYTGVLGGYEDLGRGLVCIKDNRHKIIQAKCWSQRREVRENHIYQLNSTVIHYRIQMREALFLEHGKQNGRQMMKDLDITGHLYTTTSLSEMANKVAKHLVMEYVNEPLNKTYPMIKCNINQRTKDKRYHLPFDPQYDSIIIGNVEEECYVNTIAEAEAKGFRRVG